MAQKKHGFGILDWIEDSPILRLMRVLGPAAIIFGVFSFMIALQDIKGDRDARAWSLITQKAAGNSGKIEALEYLNSENIISIPNPRSWGLPIGPTAVEGQSEPPKEWIRLVENFGPWKGRTPLIGIDLGCDVPLENREECRDRGTYLYGVNLSNARLRNSIFNGAALQSGDFSGARVSYASFIGANLHSADFSGAQVSWASFIGATLYGANFHGADAFESKFNHARLREANFSEAKLRGADFSNAYFGNWLFASPSDATNFAKADLEGAIFTKNDLTNVDFSHANLSDADFSGANLGYANLSEANLLGTKLMDADLSNSLDLKQDQIDVACTNENTILPENIQGRADCLIFMSGETVLDEDEERPIRVGEHEITEEMCEYKGDGSFLDGAFRVTICDELFPLSGPEESE